MRIARLAGLVILPGALAAVAQVSPFSVEGGQVVRTFKAECPLDMRVRQGAGGRMIATDKDGERVERFEARLKLLLTDRRPNSTGQRMVKATVLVHGWTGKEQILPVGAKRDRDENLAKMALAVPLSGGGLPDASADLNLPGFTAARLVELESITFDDGQVLMFTGSSACQAAPDPFMPVDHSK